MTRLRIASAVAIMAFLAVPVGMTAWSQDKADPKAAAGGDKSELYQQLNLFGDVLQRIRRDYVEPVDEKSLMENAINGMLSSLDPHSSDMNPKVPQKVTSRAPEPCLSRPEMSATTRVFMTLPRLSC